MSSSASALLLLLLASASAAAQERAEHVPAIPGALAERVAASIAETWRVPAAAVRLAWGHVAAAGPLEPATPFRLLGRGADGWFAVVFEPAGLRPVAARLRAGVEDTVAVAARPLPSGTRLAPEDLRWETRRSWGPPPAERSRPGDGWVVRRALAAGDPVAPPAAAPAPLVESGAAVRLVWEEGAVSISLEGVALNAAGMGDPVRVRLNGRGGLANGIVTGPGAARLES